MAHLTQASTCTLHPTGDLRLTIASSLFYATILISSSKQFKRMSLSLHLKTRKWQSKTYIITSLQNPWPVDTISQGIYNPMMSLQQLRARRKQPFPFPPSTKLLALGERITSLSIPYKAPPSTKRCAQGDLLTWNLSSASPLDDKDAGQFLTNVAECKKLSRVTANEKPEHLAT